MNLFKHSLRLLTLSALFLIWAFSSPISAQPLSGTFTIGSGGDYADFSSAAADLASEGVDGPVIFEVLNGIYDDQLDLGPITGSSSTNTITFRSQSGSAVDVTLQANSIPLGSFVVRLNGADFVNLEDITLLNGIVNQAIIEVATGASNNTIRRCIISGSSEGIRAFGQGIFNLSIEENTITCNTGIRLEGQFSSTDISQPLITGNILPAGSFSNGITLTRVDGAHVIGNQVETRSRSLRFTQCSGSSRRTLVSNNFLSVNTLLAAALDITNLSSAIDVFNNSLSAFGIRNLTSYGLQVTANCSDIQLFNNSITNFGQSAAIKIEDPASITASDFNNIYSDWVAIALWNGTQSDLASLQAASGFDGNSISVFPNYTSDTDFHTVSPYLDGAGTPLAAVTTDFDGEARDGSTPDIGADEFTSAPAATPLSGALTIGSGGNYETIGAAIDDVALRGINGPLTLNLLPGIYNEAVEIPSITGTDSLNRVTIRSQSGDTADVRITLFSNADRNATILLNSADFITLEHLTLANTSPANTVGAVVKFLDQARAVIIQNCNLINPDNAYTIWSDEQHPDEVIIRDNDIFANTAGVQMVGLVFGPYIRTPLVSGNTIFSINEGIHFQNTDGFHAIGNKIDTRSSGFNLRFNSGNARRNRIANNFIRVNWVINRGIWVAQNTVDLDILNNSIHCTDQSNTDNSALRIDDVNNSGIRVLNNSLVNSGRARAYHVNAPNAVIESDFNNIWAAGPQVAVWNGAQGELSDLQAASGMDLNSISVFPNYLSETDLHTASPYLNGAGTPLTEITTDIDGEARDGSTPDIGADEYIADPTATPLAGTFTIGSGGDYDSFQNAIDDLELRGVSGATIFEVLDGTYNEQLVIHDIPGADAANTITFRSQSGDSTTVILNSNLNDITRNYVVRFNSADYLRLEQLTLQANGINHNRLIDFLGKAENVEIRRCRLINRTSDMIYSDAHFPDRLRIVENSFSSSQTFGGDAIRITGFTFGPFVASIDIIGNQFLDPSLSDGILLSRVNGAHVIGNHFDIRSIAVRLDASPGSVRRHLIANNFIHNTGNTAKGIEITNGTTNCDIFYNSVNATTGFLNPLRITSSSGGDIRVINNIFKTENSTAYLVENTAAVTMSDHNNLFSGNGALAGWGGSFQSTIAGLQSVSGMDLNSVSIDPPFISSTDLHLQGGEMDSLAMPLAEVSSDFDGDPRDAFFPDIGADELNPLTVVNAIPDLTFPEDSGPVLASADLNLVFSNSGGTSFSFDVSSDNPEIIPILDGSTLSVDATADFFGNGTIEVEAMNGQGQIARDEFIVTVTPVNDPPLPPSLLLLPDDGDTLTVLNQPTAFCWSNGFDPDGDPLTYRLRVFADNTDIDIPGISENCFSVPANSFSTGQQLFWAILADDGSEQVSSDTATFFTPPFLFSDTGIPLTGIQGTNDLIDIDNDGDLDLFSVGLDESANFIMEIYRNDGNDTFTPLPTDLPSLIRADAAWADIDGDNDLDLLFSGHFGVSPTLTPFTRLYRNDGPGGPGWIFTELTAELDDVFFSHADWGDFDNDGDPDLILNGDSRESFSGDSDHITRIYRNDGPDGSDGWRFYSNINNVPLQFRFNNYKAEMLEWIDFDGDGDLDLFTAGQVINPQLPHSSFSGLFRNDGVFGVNFLRLTYVPTVFPIFQLDLAFFSGAWADADNDGDPDLYLQYADFAGNFDFISDLYLNDGPDGNDGWVFTPQQYDLLGLAFPLSGDVSWGDTDHDGYLDLVLSGTSDTTRFFRNEFGSGGGFSSFGIPLPGTGGGSSSNFADFDNDGDLDLLLSGGQGQGEPYITKFLRNHIDPANNLPQPPLQLTSTVNDTFPLLQWSDGSDMETPTDGLTYNLRVGSSPGTNDVYSGEALFDGTPLNSGAGRLGNNQSQRLENLRPGETFYWSVQTIDNQFGASAFSVEDTFSTPQLPFFDSEAGLPGNGGESDLVDVDADGDLDIFLTGLDDDVQAQTRLFINVNSDFQEIATTLPARFRSTAAWTDIDGDGDPDLLLVGDAGSLDGDTRLYRNDGPGGPGWQFTELSVSLPNVYFPKADWNDIDQDGDPDLALAGTVMNSPTIFFFGVFRNDGPDGNGGWRFSELTEGTFPGANINDMAWIDFTGDGEKELFAIGFQGIGDTTYMEIWQYDLAPVGSGITFSKLANNLPFSGIDGGFFTIAGGDIDVDGDEDLAVAWFQSGGDFVFFTDIFRNDGPDGNGGWLFTDLQTGLSSPSDGGSGKARWADGDGDGDLDLVVSGNGFVQFYRNEFPASSFTRVYSRFPQSVGGALAWGDSDNDNDLDLLVNGNVGGGDPITQLLENLLAEPNQPPAAPNNLNANVSSGTVSFHWSPGSDAKTPENGLSYNLRVGSTTGAADIISPLSMDNGQRLIAQPGNNGPDTTALLKRNLLPGTYHWSVQTVDNGYAGSSFSPEETFQIIQTKIARIRTRIRKSILPRTILRDSLLVSLFNFPKTSSSPYIIRNVTVGIDTILHSNVDDLVLTLVHNDIRDTLIYEVGSTGQDFLHTVLDDSAEISINSGTPPYSGIFRPYRPLSQFAGIDPEGEWILEIFDKETGNSGRLDAWSLNITFALPVGIGEEDGIPKQFALQQNYPNPFNPETTIQFALPEAANVQLEIFNVLGQRVARLIDERYTPGFYSVKFDGRDLASGMYFYRLKANAFVQSRKMLLIR